MNPGNGAALAPGSVRASRRARERCAAGRLADVIDGGVAGVDEQPAAPLMLFGSL